MGRKCLHMGHVLTFKNTDSMYSYSYSYSYSRLHPKAVPMDRWMAKWMNVQHTWMLCMCDYVCVSEEYLRMTKLQQIFVN